MARDVTVWERRFGYVPEPGEVLCVGEVWEDSRGGLVRVLEVDGDRARIGWVSEAVGRRPRWVSANPPPKGWVRPPKHNDEEVRRG